MLPMFSVLLPVSFFIGVGASTIGFTAWPLIVPLLYVLFGFDLYLTLMASLLIDSCNAFIITLAAVKNDQIDIRRGLFLAVLACLFAAAGIYIGTLFIPQNKDFFRGTAGFFVIVLGSGFIVRGTKEKKKLSTKDNSKKRIDELNLLSKFAGRYLPYIMYPGVALLAIQTGMFGIGGGMGYAVILMACLSFTTLKGTGTAMLITFFTNLFASCGIFFQVHDSMVINNSQALLFACMVFASVTGALVGTKIAYSLPEYKVNYLIGGVVIFAGLLATVQKYVFL